MHNLQTYTRPFQVSDIPTGIRTHCLESKKIRGVHVHEEPCLDHYTGVLTTTRRRVGPTLSELSLGILLTSEWPTDAHYTMYVSSERRRQRKNDAEAQPADICFSFCAYDLDYASHQRLPTVEDLDRLTLTLWVLDNPPNILYQTRGGARIIYLIDPIHDQNVFEPHYRALLDVLKDCISRSESGYEVDDTRDWTRLFRAPLIVRDEQPEYNNLIRTFHADRLNLQTFKVKKTKRKEVIRDESRNIKPYDVGDPYLLKLYDNIQEGSHCRNNSLFKASCHIFKHYNEEGMRTWLEHFRCRAQQEGLQEDEIERTILSAANKEYQK